MNNMNNNTMNNYTMHNNTIVQNGVCWVYHDVSGILVRCDIGTNCVDNIMPFNDKWRKMWTELTTINEKNDHVDNYTNSLKRRYPDYPLNIDNDNPSKHSRLM